MSAPKKKPAGKAGKPPARRNPAEEQRRQSEDIERAVYDGMQDLRVKENVKKS